MIGQRLLHLARVDVVALGDDEVLRTPGDLVAPVVGRAREVPGPQPSVAGEPLRRLAGGPPAAAGDPPRRPAGPPPVALHDVRSPDDELAGLARRDLRAVAVDDAHVD